MIQILILFLMMNNAFSEDFFGTLKSGSHLWINPDDRSKMMNTVKVKTRVKIVYSLAQYLGVTLDSKGNVLWVYKSNVQLDESSLNLIATKNLYSLKGIINKKLNPYIDNREESIRNLEVSLEEKDEVNIIDQRGIFYQITYKQKLVGWIKINDVDKIELVKNENDNVFIKPLQSSKKYMLVQGQCHQSELQVNQKSILLPVYLSALDYLKLDENENATYYIQIFKNKFNKNVSKWYYEIQKNDLTRKIMLQGKGELPNSITMNTFERHSLKGRLVVEYYDSSKFEESFKVLDSQKKVATPQVIVNQMPCDYLLFSHPFADYEKVLIKNNHDFLSLVDYQPEWLKVYFADASSYGPIKFVEDKKNFIDPIYNEKEKVYIESKIQEKLAQETNTLNFFVNFEMNLGLSYQISSQANQVSLLDSRFQLHFPLFDFILISIDNQSNLLNLNPGNLPYYYHFTQSAFQIYLGKYLELKTFLGPLIGSGSVILKNNLDEFISELNTGFLGFNFYSGIQLQLIKEVKNQIQYKLEAKILSNFQFSFLNLASFMKFSYYFPLQSHFSLGSSIETLWIVGKFQNIVPSFILQYTL